MKMIEASTLSRLLAGMPPLGEVEELILRPDRVRPTATVRRDDAPPKVYAMHGETLLPLDPAADAGLPGAPLLVEHGILNEIIGPITGELTGGELVAWRPGRRAVLRLTLRDGGTRWLKLLDKKNFRRAVTAFGEVRGTRAPLTLALPTHLLPAICGYITEPARGVSLRALRTSRPAPPLGLIANAVMALAGAKTGTALPVHDFARARAATAGMLRKAAALRPALAELAAIVEAIESPPPPERPGLVHGDLHDKQLFLTNTGADLIDLEGMAWGDTRFDSINLTEHLRLRDLQENRADQGLGDTLLGLLGFDSDGPATRAYRLVVRARLCGVYALRPRWAGLCERLHDESLALARRLERASSSARPGLRLPANTADL